MVEISLIKKNGRKYFVTFDNKENLLLCEDVLVKQNLYVGKKVEIDIIKKDNEYCCLLDKVLKKCLKPLTINETKEYLDSLSNKKDLKEQILVYLTKIYLDDNKVIAHIISNHNYSRVELKSALYKRLVSDDLVDRCVQEYDESISFHILYEKKMKFYQKSFTKLEAKRKTLMYLSGRGFELKDYILNNGDE